MTLSDFKRIEIVYKAMAKSGIICAGYAKNVRRAWRLFHKLYKKGVKN